MKKEEKRTLRAYGKIRVFLKISGVYSKAKHSGALECRKKNSVTFLSENTGLG
jgi:hypothetical protein